MESSLSVFEDQTALVLAMEKRLTLRSRENDREDSANCQEQEPKLSEHDDEP